MTTLTNKLQEITKRLQSVTIWRPDERDPFFELDRWRNDAHAAIEQIFVRKRQQIELIIEKHEREFMRQLTRQRSLLSNIRKRLASKKDMAALNTTQNDVSILTDLQKIENDINTRLGRAEVIIQTVPANFDDSVTVGLKTYLSITSPLYVTNVTTLNEPKRPKHRSTAHVEQGYNKWLQEKKIEAAIMKKETEAGRVSEEESLKMRLQRENECKHAYRSWLSKKATERVRVEKKININSTDLRLETTVS